MTGATLVLWLSHGTLNWLKVKPVLPLSHRSITCASLQICTLLYGPQGLQSNRGYRVALFQYQPHVVQNWHILVFFVQFRKAFFSFPFSKHVWQVLLFKNNSCSEHKPCLLPLGDTVRPQNSLLWEKQGSLNFRSHQGTLCTIKKLRVT